MSLEMSCYISFEMPLIMTFEMSLKKSFEIKKKSKCHLKNHKSHSKYYSDCHLKCFEISLKLSFQMLIKI